MFPVKVSEVAPPLGMFCLPSVSPSNTVSCFSTDLSALPATTPVHDTKKRLTNHIQNTRREETQCLGTNPFNGPIVKKFGFSFKQIWWLLWLWCLFHHSSIFIWKNYHLTSLNRFWALKLGSHLEMLLKCLRHMADQWESRANGDSRALEFENLISYLPAMRHSTNHLIQLYVNVLISKMGMTFASLSGGSWIGIWVRLPGSLHLKYQNSSQPHSLFLFPIFLHCTYHLLKYYVSSLFVWLIVCLSQLRCKFHANSTEEEEIASTYSKSSSSSSGKPPKSKSGSIPKRRHAASFKVLRALVGETYMRGWSSCSQWWRAGKNPHPSQDTVPF